MDSWDTRMWKLDSVGIFFDKIWKLGPTIDHHIRWFGRVLFIVTNFDYLGRNRWNFFVQSIIPTEYTPQKFSLKIQNCSAKIVDSSRNIENLKFVQDWNKKNLTAEVFVGFFFSPFCWGCTLEPESFFFTSASSPSVFLFHLSDFCPHGIKKGLNALKRRFAFFFYGFYFLAHMKICGLHIGATY